MHSCARDPYPDRVWQHTHRVGTTHGMAKRKMKTSDLTIRLTPDERAGIEKAAEAQHLPVSTWLRRLALVESTRLQEEAERREKGRAMKAWLLEELWRLPADNAHADEVERARREWGKRGQR